MACRHGACPMPEADAQASAVEHARGLAGRGRGELRFAAASFKNSALTSRRRELWSVQASVHGADRRLAPRCRRQRGLSTTQAPLPHRNRIEVDCAIESATAAMAVFCSFESSDWSGGLRQAGATI